MKQITFNISNKAYKQLSKLVEEAFDGDETIESLLQKDMNQPDTFAELLGWDNF